MEGGHLITEHLFRTRRSSTDGLPNLLQNLLNIRGKARNVLIDRFGGCLIHIHRIPSVKTDAFTAALISAALMLSYVLWPSATRVALKSATSIQGSTLPRK